MAKKSFLRRLKKEAAQKLDLKKLFPKTNVKLNRKLTEYQVRKIKKALGDIQREEKIKEVTGGKPAQVIAPDNPPHYEAAGFKRIGKKIYSMNEKLIFSNVYKSSGKFSFYSANFFGGVANVQLMPLNFLPSFLDEQILRDEESGIFYDKITLKEGDRNFYTRLFDSAEELLLWMTQYKRHGALIGEGGSFDYIQVCFINFGG